MSNERIVTLNVGGACFVTRHVTLASSQSFFSAIVRAHPDESELFIDRDPMYFRHVLNWMRGARVLPVDDAPLAELEAEADYYNMPDLLAAIQRARRRTLPSMQKSLVEAVCELRRR